MGRLGLVAFALIAAACGASDTAATGGATRIEASLALDLPMGDDDSVLVGSLQDATRLSDGRLALLDLDRKAVVLLTPEGKLLGVTGRDGAGPGEFQLPLWLGRCGADTLYVWDRGLVRVSILSPAGDLVREFRPAITAPFRPECLPDGRFVTLDARAGSNYTRATSTNAPRIHGALVVMSRDGDSLAAVPGLVLGQSKTIGELADMAVLSDRVVIGLNSSPELSTYSLEAALLGRDTVPLAPEVWSDQRYEAMVTRQAASTGGDSTIRAMIRKMIIAEGKSAAAPLFQTMHGSPDGLVWWVTSLPVDSATTLVGFRDGAPVFELALPAEIEPFEIGTDYLLGRRLDQDGLEHLVLYRWQP